MRRPAKAPPPGAVGALIAAIGFGVACWYGWAWYQVPRWSEQEIEGSVELNLALDLSRLPPGGVTSQMKDRMRAQIRRELEEQISGESDEPRQLTMAGLLMALFGLVQMAVRAMLEPH